MYREKTLNNKMVNYEIINMIIASLFSRSPREQQHSIEVASLCQLFGEFTNMPETELKKIKNVGFLHDIGKIILSLDQLNNSPNSMDLGGGELRSHPLTGYRLLNSCDNTMELADIVLSHHEHWDGAGYPKGLKEEEIPPLARVSSVVECYERVLAAGLA